RLSDSDHDWNIYRSDEGATWRKVAGGTFHEGIRQPANSVWTLDELSVFAGRDETCRVTFIQAADGRVLGNAQVAYPDGVAIGSVNDVIFIETQGRRDMRYSLQVFDFPDLIPGPWFIQGNEDLEDGVDASSSPRFAQRRPLMVHAWQGVLVSK